MLEKTKKSIKNTSYRLSSMILAGMMIVSTAIGGTGSIMTVSAEEPAVENTSATDDKEYTVEIRESENGKVAFKDAEEKTKTFKKGDKVEIVITPDENYQVDLLTVSNTDTKETMANAKQSGGFSFEMPATNLTVEGTFKKTEVSEAVKTKTDTKAEVTETNVDPVTAQYIMKNINTKYAKADKAELANTLIVKQTLADGKKIKKGTTIDSFFNNDDVSKIGEAWLGEMPGAVAVYNTDDSSDYYVAYANTMQNDKNSKVIDYVFAILNTNGETIKGKYDSSTGLAYIPKSAYKKGNDIVLNNVQVQFLQSMSEKLDNADSKVQCTITDEEDKTVKTGSGSVEALDMKTSVKTDKNLSKDEMIVAVNGIPVGNDEYSYNKETGVVTVNVSSVNIQSITVNKKDKATAAKIADKYLDITEANAAGAWTSTGIQCAGTVNLPAGAQENSTYTLTMTHYYNDSGYNKTNPSAIIPYGLNFPGIVGDGPKGVNLTDFIFNGSTNGFTNNDINLISPEPNDINVALDFSGFWNFQDTHGHGTLIPLRCCHITNPLGASGAPKARPVFVRVLKIEGTDVLLGVMSSNVYTQTGASLIYVKTTPQSGKLSLKKASSNPDMTNGNKCYSLEGAKFEVKKDGNIVKTVTTDANGNAVLDGLSEGSYTVKETVAPKGFEINPQTYSFTIKAGETTTVNVEDTPKNDPLVITVTKDDADGIANQGSATLAGAQFTVKYYDGDYTEANLPSKATRTWVIETKERKDTVTGKIVYRTALKEEYKVSGDAYYKDSDGKVVIPYGTVTVEETKAPEGYTLKDLKLKTSDGKTLPNGKLIAIINDATLPSFTAENHSLEMTDNVIRGGVEVQKRDFETKEAKPQGSASFEGTEFTIYSENDNDILVDGKTYKKGDAITVLKSDKNGHAATSDKYLPYGKYRIVETKAPKGYVLKGVTELPFEIVEDGKIVDLTKKGLSIEDRISRGDFEFNKKSLETQRSMANVKFKITSKATKESHIIWTDDNGYYSSASSYVPHTENSNDDKPGSGLFMGVDSNGNAIAPNDEVGALPYGTYIVEEMKCAANEHKKLISFDVVITKDSYTVNAGTINNEDLTLQTTAKEEETNSHYSPSTGKVTVIDTVKYSGLDVNKEHVIKGVVMNKTTGAPVTDKNGKPVTGETTFTPVTSKGTVEVEFNFDAKDLAGTDVVIFEECYMNGKLIVDHKDINDEGQTVHFPKIKTKAADSETNMNLTNADKDVVIIDTVSYQNLKVGREYTMNGTLMNKETGKPVLDANGKEIKASTKFTPETKDGTVDIEFRFDGSNLAGETIVAFEEVEYKNVVYTTHTNIEDEDQTVYIPKLKTTAVDKETETHNAMAGKEITIVDTVEYKNVIAGKEYTVKGVLMDKSTGEALKVNGKEITSEATFTAEDTEGTIDIEFTFDGTGLEGKTIVVFENAYHEGFEVASHADIEDKDQSVYIPKIRTTATDKESNSHNALADEEVTIVDKVKYENLIPGKEYTVKGILMDKETGEKLLVDGKEVTGETVFTPEEAEGTVDVEFTFNGSALKNKTIVVFEDVLLEEHTVGTHADIEDEDQSVHFPEVHTTATDKADGDKEVLATTSVSITDRVEYTNLIPGQTYTVEGVLMDKATGKPLLINGLPVTAKSEFTAEKSDGFVDVAFTFNASGLDNKVAVVFETLKTNGVEVATHADINDEGQTVKFVTPPKTVKTGDNGTVIPFMLGAGLCGFAGIGTLLGSRKKRENN